MDTIQNYMPKSPLLGKINIVVVLLFGVITLGCAAVHVISYNESQSAFEIFLGYKISMAQWAPILGIIIGFTLSLWMFALQVDMHWLFSDFDARPKNALLGTLLPFINIFSFVRNLGKIHNKIDEEYPEVRTKEIQYDDDWPENHPIASASSLSKTALTITYVGIVGLLLSWPMARLMTPTMKAQFQLSAVGFNCVRYAFLLAILVGLALVLKSFNTIIVKRHKSLEA